MRPLWQLSATELATLVRSRRVSAVQAATAALERLDAVNPKINAVVDHRPEDALAQAAAVDRAIARGDDPGALAGVPVTIKVNVDQQGFATTNGIRAQRDHIAREDNPVVANMRRAGAVIVRAGAELHQPQPRADLRPAAADLRRRLLVPGVRAALPAYGAQDRDQDLLGLPPLGQ